MRIVAGRIGLRRERGRRDDPQVGPREHPRESHLDVPGPWRHVDEQVVELTPVDVAEKLLEQAMHHRTAPHDGLVLVDEEPERFYVPPYVGGRGWIGVRLDRKPDWNEIAEILGTGVTTVTPIERNRVNLTFTINEGETARVRDIDLLAASLALIGYAACALVLTGPDLPGPLVFQKRGGPPKASLANTVSRTVPQLQARGRFVRITPGWTAFTVTLPSALIVIDPG